MAKPIIRNDPVGFEPVKHPYHVTTLENARFLVNACEAWTNSIKDPEQFGTAEDVLKDFPGTTHDSSCRWALYGLPVQAELQAEQDLERLADYVTKLREINDFHKQQLIDRYNDFQQWAKEDHERIKSRVDK